MATKASPPEEALSNLKIARNDDDDDNDDEEGASKDVRYVNMALSVSLIVFMLVTMFVALPKIHPSEWGSSNHTRSHGHHGGGPNGCTAQDAKPTMNKAASASTGHK